MRLKIAGLFVICTALAFAQGDRGTITGTVTDPTGAVIPNANIEVTNSDTAALYKIGTSNTGNYTLANLPAGTYTLIVEAAGFKRFERPGLIVQVADLIRANGPILQYINSSHASKQGSRCRFSAAEKPAGITRMWTISSPEFSALSNTNSQLRTRRPFKCSISATLIR